MNRKFEEVMWIILALLATLTALFETINHSGNEVNWLILMALCFLVSLEHRKIRKEEEKTLGEEQK